MQRTELKSNPQSRCSIPLHPKGSTLLINIQQDVNYALHQSQLLKALVLVFVPLFSCSAQCLSLCLLSPPDCVTVPVTSTSGSNECRRRQQLNIMLLEHRGPAMLLTSGHLLQIPIGRSDEDWGQGEGRERLEWKNTSWPRSRELQKQRQSLQVEAKTTMSNPSFEMEKKKNTNRMLFCVKCMFALLTIRDQATCLLPKATNLGLSCHPSLSSSLPALADLKQNNVTKSSKTNPPRVTREYKLLIKSTGDGSLCCLMYLC